MPFIPPMLATRLEDPRRLADPRYSAEPKLDGQRAQLHYRRPRRHHRTRGRHVLINRPSRRRHALSVAAPRVALGRDVERTRRHLRSDSPSWIGGSLETDSLVTASKYLI